VTNTAAGLKPVKIKQNRGPTLKFEGRLIASTEWEARDSLMTFDDGRGDYVSAGVIEPADEDEMRFAVLGFWDWTHHARAMVKKLGWSLVREIA
jgi:hypothetical protein